MFRIGCVRFVPEVSFIILYSFLVILQIRDVGVAPLVVIVGIGFDLQTLVVIGDGLVIFLLAAIDKPPALVRLRVIGILLQNRGKIRSRFIPVAQPDLGESPQSDRYGVVWF